LLGGVIYDVPAGMNHRYAVSKLHQVLARGLESQYVVRSQNAVAVSGWQGKDAIMRHGRWHSERVARRYIRAGQRWDDNAAARLL
jgi:hypothetical protein